MIFAFENCFDNIFELWHNSPNSIRRHLKHSVQPLPRSDCQRIENLLNFSQTALWLLPNSCGKQSAPFLTTQALSVPEHLNDFDRDDSRLKKHLPTGILLAPGRMRPTRIFATGCPDDGAAIICQEHPGGNSACFDKVGYSLSTELSRPVGLLSIIPGHSLDSSAHSMG